MLALLEGRWPSAAGEVALTDTVAATFQVRVGGQLHLDGRDRTVVGLVENPSDLGDKFALVPPSHADPPRSVTILARASRQRASALPATVQAQWESRPQCHATLICLTPGQSEQATAAAGVLGLTTVVLLLVSLIAAAGFVVVAQRRLRQLGMLAAIGATEQHLRLVLLANGALVGAIAAVIGTAIAMASWITVAPALETATGHRFDLPWWLIGGGMLLAVVTATAAAWWPARTVARIPVTRALSARPPQPKPAHRSGLAAGLLITTSVVCLAAGIDAGRDRVNPPLVIIGTVTMVLGSSWSGRWRSGSWRRPVHERRSRCGWPCATCPATRPGQGRHWPRSASAWRSQWPSLWPRAQPSTPPTRATCRTGRS